MISASWAICPACSAVTGDPETHAAWHASLAAGLDPTGTPPQMEGDQWPAGQTVVATPPAPSPEEIEVLHMIVREGRDYLAQIPQGRAMIEAYLALRSPTTAQTVAHVRSLTQIQRGVLTAVRDLIRATM